MDITIVRAAFDAAKPGPIEPRHLLAAALAADASIAPRLAALGVDAALVASRAADAASWEAALQSDVEREAERGYRELANQPGVHAQVDEWRRRLDPTAGPLPADADPEAALRDVARRIAEADVRGADVAGRVASGPTERILGDAERGLLDGGVRADGPAAGDDVHLRALVVLLVPRALALDPPVAIDRRALTEAFLPELEDALRAGRKPRGGAYHGSRFAFEEAEVERDRTLRARHVLVAALRTLADKGVLHRFEGRDWHAVRRTLGYVRTEHRDPNTQWGLQQCEPVAMEAMTAANEAANAPHDAACDRDVRWACTLAVSIRTDPRMGALLADVGVAALDLDRLRCACGTAPVDVTKTVAAATDLDAPPPRFRLLWQKECEIDDATRLQARHVIVAALRCLSELTATLTAPGALDRLRATLRAAGRDAEPPAGQPSSPVAEPVIAALLRANALRSFGWWPGIAPAAEQALDAAVFADTLLRDAALAAALPEAGLKLALARRAIAAASRGAHLVG